jgi:hypothetical protein
MLTASQGDERLRVLRIAALGGADLGGNPEDLGLENGPCLAHARSICLNGLQRSRMRQVSLSACRVALRKKI